MQTNEPNVQTITNVPTEKNVPNIKNVPNKTTAANEKIMPNEYSNQEGLCDSSSEGPSFNEYEQRLGSQVNRNIPTFRLNVHEKREDLREKLKQNRERLRKVRADINRLSGKNLICFNCSNAHPMCKCVRFIQLPLRERERRVNELGLCRNCFAPEKDGHMCSSKHSHCVRCGPGYRHNSLLCDASPFEN